MCVFIITYAFIMFLKSLNWSVWSGATQPHTLTHCVVQHQNIKNYCLVLLSWLVDFPRIPNIWFIFYMLYEIKYVCTVKQRLIFSVWTSKVTTCSFLVMPTDQSHLISSPGKKTGNTKTQAYKMKPAPEERKRERSITQQRKNDKAHIPAV